MFHGITNIDKGRKHGAYDPRGNTTQVVLNYFAHGKSSADRHLRLRRLQAMSDSLFKLGLRSSTGHLPNPLAYAIGSNNREVRVYMIKCARENNDPMETGD